MSAQLESNPIASGLGAIPEKTLTALANRTNQWIGGAALVSSIAIVVLAVLKAEAAITAIALGIIIISGLGIIFFFGTKNFASEAKKIESQVERINKNIKWSRRLLRMPLDNSIKKQIKNDINHVHQAACTKLAAMKIQGFQTKNVRVNIFLPNIEYAEYGEILGLSIHEGFHVNMAHKPEFDLRFRPNEGLSGLVFAGEEIGIAWKRPGGWKRGFIDNVPEDIKGKEGAFRLTKWQEALIHPKLMWILSYPLLVPENDSKTSAVGVLNIDGIGFSLTEAQIKQLKETLTDEVNEIALRFKNAQTDRVSIILENIH